MYSEPSHWSPNRVPGPSDSVVFTNPGSYLVAVDVAVSNASAVYHEGSVTQAVSSSGWFLTNAFRVGESVASTSRVTIVSGLLAVTNDTKTAVLSVGRKGKGELEVLGGDVVADRLVATNGSNSIVSFEQGTLTTLNGSAIDLDASLTLCSTPTNLFTWNVLGGTNRIITGEWDYGGLTLGANEGRAVVNLVGSNTLLSVPGLDSYGGNEIHISEGAELQTRRVQWGLGSGASNLVTISGRGSSWINAENLNFGMHNGGGETLIITNGGYLRSGVPPHLASFSWGAYGGNRIIVTGSNSWFHSQGQAFIGGGSGLPPRTVENLIMVTNGGRFSASHLMFGPPGSFPGTVVNVADGNLELGVLHFGVGTLRVEKGTCTIEELNLTGGTNSVIQIPGTFHVGPQGKFGPGDLMVGLGPSGQGPSLNGELQLGGWRIGQHSHSSAAITGGRVFVTNASQTASIVVGNIGALHVFSGCIEADEVSVESTAAVWSVAKLRLTGADSSLTCNDLVVSALGRGVLVADDSARLKFSRCTASASSIYVTEATLDLSSGASAISSNAIIATDASILYRDALDVPIDLDDPMTLGRIQRVGGTSLEMIQATNSYLPELVLSSEGESAWSRAVLNGGISTLDAGAILVETNSSLAATNTSAIVTGSFTCRGQLLLQDSKLRVLGPTTLSRSTRFEGTNSVLMFEGGLHLPATDFVVREGLAIQASHITSDGGGLVIDGGGIIPNEDGTIPEGVQLLHDGWVTYVDEPSAPLAPPVGFPQALGFELIRSTNAPLESFTFQTGSDGYERVRLGAGAEWRSARLTISQGGSMFLADSSASVILTSRVFRVEHGGVFRDDTAPPSFSYIGFSPFSTNATAVVSGTGSTWIARDVLIGEEGRQNHFLIEAGGTARTATTTMGGWDNLVTVSGKESTLFATNGIRLGGFGNEFLLREGTVFAGPKISDDFGGDGTISIIGNDASMTSDQLSFSRWGYGGSKLVVKDGASLFNRIGDLASIRGCSVEVSGDGSRWVVSQELRIKSPWIYGDTNRVAVGMGGLLSTPLLNVADSRFTFCGLAINAGEVFVTNETGTAKMRVYGVLDLRGGLVRADTLNAAGWSAVIGLHAGRAEWRACDFAAGTPLRVGDATNLMTLELLGGTNICRGGLDVQPLSRLCGAGVIIGAVTNSGWFWPSAMSIQDNLILAPSSELGFTIGEAAGDLHGSFLTVTGNVALAGRLAVSIGESVTPSETESFVLFEYGTISSEFVNITFGDRLLTSDRLASFLIEDTGTAVIARGFQSEDLDGDEIQDAWAIEHFGFSPLLPGHGADDLDGDLDGDGLSNRDEFLLDKDPEDPLSSLFVGLVSTSNPPAGVGIRFEYFPGRAHVILSSDDLESWTETPITEFRFDSDGFAVWSDIETNTPPPRYYRLLLR